MRLVLFRHGIAVDREDPDVPADPERPLTGRGRRRTRAAVAGLARLGVAPDRLLTSPYLRARETADEVRDVLGLGVRPEVTPALLPAAHPSEVFGLLGEEEGAEVLCAGHAPHLDLALAWALGVGQPVTRLKKAGAACLELPVQTPGRARLVWLAEPRSLRALGARP